MLEVKFANPVIAKHLTDAELYHEGDYASAHVVPTNEKGSVVVTFLSGRSRDERTGFNLLTLQGINEWSSLFKKIEYDASVIGIVMADSADPHGKRINPGIDVKEFGPALRGLANDNAQPMNHLLNTGCRFYEQVYQYPKPVAGALASRNMGGVIELIVNPVGFLALGNGASIMSPECRLDLLGYLKKAGYDPTRDFGIDENHIADRFNVFEGWLQAQTGLQAMIKRKRPTTRQDILAFNDKCAFTGHEVSAREALEYGRADMIGAPENLLPMAIGWVKGISIAGYKSRKFIGDNGWGPVASTQGAKRTTIGQVAVAYVLYDQTYRSLDEMIAMNNAALIQSIVEGYGIEERCPNVYDQVRKITGVNSFLSIIATR